MTSFGSALDALDAAGVAHRLRKPFHPSMGGMEGDELDLWITRRNRRASRDALQSAGFHPMRAPGQGRHRFYVAWEAGRWWKVDVKEGRPPDTLAALGRVGRSLGAAARSPFGAMARRLPAGIRRRGPVVAVLGPDGAGKGTVIEALAARIPLAVTARYLGGGTGRTARAGGAAGRSNGNGSSSRNGNGNGNGNGHRGSRPGRPPGPVRECLFVMAKAVRGWSKLVSVYALAWRGHIVLCDRHPIEVLATRPDRTPPAGALEGWLVRHLTPRPDAIVLLDAPAEVLFGRKHEHSVTVLERWRNAYTEVFVERGAATVSTVGPREGTVDAASQVVWEALWDRRRW